MRVLIGINSAHCQLLDWNIGRFCLTAQLQNKKDKLVLYCTTVYGPIDAHLKLVF
jgi:hypothetical protein